MTRSAKRACLMQLGIGFGMLTVLTGGSARAGDGPLLVVVEAPPALDADAAEIRRAIGTELHSRTVAPMKTPAETSDRALIVALDRDRIAMSLRTSDAAPVARSIPAPPERAARLRAIAWLAGNLARDQVGPLVAEAPVQMPSLATLPPTEVAPSVTEPPPRVPVAPPPSEAHLTGDSATTISSRAHAEKPAGPSRWSILVTDGPTTNFPICHVNNGSSSGPPAFCAPFLEYGTAWRLEAQHRSGSGGFFTGAALSGTAGAGSSGGDFAPQLIGALAYVGSSRHLGRWTFEVTGGAGLELATVFRTVYTVTLSSSGGATADSTSSDAVTPALFADGTAALAHPVSETLDIVLRLGAHLTTVTYENWFLSSTIGLRYNLP
jgi:hypothetical protein